MLTKRWKLILITTFIIWIFSIYLSVQFTNEIILLNNLNNNDKDAQKWVVQPGDIIEFESFINSNSTAYTLVDRIVSEYRYDECDKDVWGNRIIQVRAKDVPTHINITMIAEQIINLSGPVQIEQEINGTWELKRDIILPFFIPIGFWNNLSSEFKKILPVGAMVEYSYSWVGEYKYTLKWNSGIFSYSVYYVWASRDGVLQATVINVTSSDGKTDSFEMHLSSQKMSYESEEIQIDYTTLQNIGLILLILAGITSFPVVGGYTLKKIRDEKEKEKRKTETYHENKYHEISSILVRWDEVKRTYILLWFGANLICFIIGFWTFASLINISEEVTSKIPIITTIITGLFIAVIFTGILYYYITRLTRHCNKKLTRGFASDSSPLISFMLGFIYILFGSIIRSIFMIPTMTGKIIMLGIFIVLIFTISIAYFVMRPWKDLNSIREFLEDDLELLQNIKR